MEDIIKLEDGINYIITETIRFGDNEYLYLTNENDVNDFCIRKVVNDEIIGLEDENEYNKALLLINEKYN